MRKIMYFFITGILFCSTINSQKTFTDPNAEIRPVGSFHGIDVSTGIELNLTAGNTEEVAVSASSTEFRDKIVTKIENGILKIYYESKVGAVNTKKQSKNLKAYVSYKMLDLLNASSGASLKINGIMQLTSLEVQANTGSMIEGEIYIKKLKINQNTGSKITFSGKADKLELEGNTGSKFIGEELNTVICDTKVSTGAQVNINVNNELKAKANTGGMVKYKGDAPVREIKTNTGGTVKRIKNDKLN